MRADELRGLRPTAAAFLGRSSPRVLTAAVALGVVRRLRLGMPTLGDALAVASVAVAAGPVEWLAHRHLFHGPLGRAVGLGGRHRGHHDDPDDLDLVLLHPAAAVAGAALAATLAGGGARLTGARPPAVASAVTAASAALWRYEWTHLRVHSRDLPRSSRIARLARHHRRHHHRDHTVDFGVTTTRWDRPWVVHSAG